MNETNFSLNIIVTKLGVFQIFFQTLQANVGSKIFLADRYWVADHSLERADSQL